MRALVDRVRFTSREDGTIVHLEKDIVLDARTPWSRCSTGSDGASAVRDGAAAGRAALR